jgi:hypothetical protein
MAAVFRPPQVFRTRLADPLRTAQIQPAQTGTAPTRTATPVRSIISLAIRTRRRQARAMGVMPALSGSRVWRIAPLPGRRTHPATPLAHAGTTTASPDKGLTPARLPYPRFPAIVAISRMILSVPASRSSSLSNSSVIRCACRGERGRGRPGGDPSIFSDRL